MILFCQHMYPLAVFKFLYNTFCLNASGMCSVLDLTGESGLNRLKDYEYYRRLDNDDEKALIALCLALNPVELDGGISFNLHC